jgi:hypothetical protein
MCMTNYLIKVIKYIILYASGTVINYGYGSGSDFLTSYGSGSTSQKVTVPVPQRWSDVKHIVASL